MDWELNQYPKKEKINNSNINSLKKYLLKENLFISICASLFYLNGASILALPPNFYLTSFIFWSTLLIYQINTKLKLNIADISSFQNIDKVKKWRIITYFIITIILILHIPFLNTWSIMYIAHLGILSTLYNVPEKSYSKSIFPLRSIPLLKVFLIAYVWASIASILPTIDDNIIITRYVILSFIFQFLFILSITLPFDIRDYKRDIKSYIVTVPHVFGIKNTKIFAILCLFIFTILFITTTGKAAILIVTFVSGILIANVFPDKKDHYFTFYLDGTIILYFIIVQLFVN